MKKIFEIFLITVYILNFQAYSEENKPIIFATGEYAPFSSKDIEGHGIIGEFISEIVRDMGEKKQFDFVPWIRCEQLLTEGKAWGAFPYSRTKWREKKYLYSDLILPSSSYFFYYKNNIKGISIFEKLEDLRSYKIGGIAGYYYEKRFKKANLNVLYFNNEVISLKALVSKKIDLLPMDRAVAHNLIMKVYPNKIDKFTYIDKQIHSAGLYVMVSKSYPKTRKILKKFNRSLKKLKENGTLERIINKYQLDNRDKYDFLKPIVY